MSIDAALAAMKQHVETACENAAKRARTHLAAELNQIARRLREYEDEPGYLRAVMDAASLFASQAALFSLENQSLKLRLQTALSLAPDLSITLASAHGFSTAATSKEVVVCLRTAAEVGEALASEDRIARGLLFPIQNAERVAAVLFVPGAEDADVQGLELVSGLATLALSARSAKSVLSAAIAPAPAPAATPIPPSPAPGSAKLPPWSALSEQQRTLHWRAQRFARVKVAEWMLAKPEACRAGLEQNDIYLFLKKEIDGARENYRKQFVGDDPMVDYLHLELVGAAAEGDETKLGKDYPGPLV